MARVLRRLAMAGGWLLAATAGHSADRIRAEEESLIQVLRSESKVAERAAACVRLQRIGTERAVPALAALLVDPALAHSARFALETMPGFAAGQALVAALDTTTGAERLGIVSSLAVRREGAAVPSLVKLLAAPGDREATGSAPDQSARETLASAVAAALGAMDSDAALAALESAASRPEPTVQAAVGDALLAQADRRLQRGEATLAARLCRGVISREQRPTARAAGYLGLMRAAGPERLALWRAAVLGEPGPEQTAALQATALLPWTGLDAVLAEVMPRVPSERQRALLAGWLQRQPGPARASVLPLLESPAEEVRLAAIRALGQVGAADDVERLLDLAAGQGMTQAAARDALACLRPSGVAPRLISRLADGREGVRVEAARALGERGERVAVAALLTLARDDREEGRRAALRALVQVLGAGEVEALVQLVVSAPNESRRGEVARALALVYDRLQPGVGSPALVPLLRELRNGTATTRAALWSAASAVVAPELGVVWRMALHDREPAVRAAAIRAASLTNDPELLPDLRALACRDGNEEYRELATKACVRLVGRPGAQGALAERLELMRAIAASAPTPAQQRSLLNGLAAGRTAAELELAERFLADAAVWNDAAATVVKIAPRLPEAAAARAVLQLVGAAQIGPDLRQEIDAALASVEARARYVTSWQVSAPLRVADSATEGMLEAELRPEVAGADFRTPAARARLARWTPLAVGSDGRNPMLMRGGGPEAFGVVYAYTWLWSPVAQRARLELWHDGGAKVWLSDTQVLSSAEEVGLPPKAGASAEVALAEGWNLLRVKFAQPAKAWSFAVRVSGRDGAPLPEVLADAEGGW